MQNLRCFLSRDAVIKSAMNEFWNIANYYGVVFLHEWLDVVWVGIAPLILHRGQRLKAMIFALLCVIVLRLQVESLEQVGVRHGLSGLFHWPLLTRGFVVYGIFNLVYLILSRLSPATRGPIYLAATLSIFFMAFVASTIVLLI